MAEQRKNTEADRQAGVTIARGRIRRILRKTGLAAAAGFAACVSAATDCLAAGGGMTLPDTGSGGFRWWMFVVVGAIGGGIAAGICLFLTRKKD